MNFISAKNEFTIEMDNITTISLCGNIPYVYFNGKWSKIISKPKQANKLIKYY